jgi:hypothetical protein
LTVLLGGLSTVAALFIRARLYPGKEEELAIPGVTDDTFTLVLREPAAAAEVARACALLWQHHPRAIQETEMRR